MVDKIERLYTIPLRGAYDYKRNKRAIRAIDNIKEFIARHMKSNLVKISNALNASIWSKGITKPPRKVKVKAIKDGDKVIAYLPDEKLEQEKETKKEIEKKPTETTKIEDKKSVERQKEAKQEPKPEKTKKLKAEKKAEQ